MFDDFSKYSAAELGKIIKHGKNEEKKFATNILDWFQIPNVNRPAGLDGWI